MLHLFGIPCLVHASLHPTIYPCFKSNLNSHLQLRLCLFTFYFSCIVALYLEWLLALFRANMYTIALQHVMLHFKTTLTYML